MKKMPALWKKRRKILQMFLSKSWQIKMIFKNRKIQKFISFFLITATFAPSFLIFSIPKKAEAQVLGTGAVSTVVADIGATISATLNAANTVLSSTNVGLKIKDVAKEIAKEVAMAAARRLLAEMTKNTVNWINTGFP